MNDMATLIHKNIQKLKLVDINLQIEAARISEANGIRVIAMEIKDLIEELEIILDKL